jgi:hypothetical protein
MSSVIFAFGAQKQILINGLAAASMRQNGRGLVRFVPAKSLPMLAFLIAITLPPEQSVDCRHSATAVMSKDGGGVE